MRLVIILASLMSLLLGSSSWALEKVHTKDKPKGVEEKVQGWDGSLTLGSGVSLSSSQKVVGQTDGTMFTLGLNVDGGLLFRRRSHEWRTVLAINEMFSRTPAVEKFVKTTDKLALESIYLYSLRRIPWLGPYGRFMLETAILEGKDVRAEEVTYQEVNKDGTPGNTRLDDEKKLTHAFQPLQLKESAGAFAKPWEKGYFDLEFRIGFGSRQTFADGGWAIDDDKDTAEIELKELFSYAQAGFEAGVYATGKLTENKVTYKLFAEAMTPLWNSDSEEDRNALELTNVELGAKLSFKLFSWSSLDYELKVVRQPQLLDDWQILNSLLLNFNFTLVARKTPPTEEKK